MSNKEDDLLYFQGEDFFAGKPINFHFINAVLSYAHRMNSSKGKLPCDEVMVNINIPEGLTPEVVRWYLMTRGVVINEIKMNSRGTIEFSVMQVRRPLSSPEPDF